jgi:hypothetical protein
VGRPVGDETVALPRTSLQKMQLITTQAAAYAENIFPGVGMPNLLAPGLRNL